MAISMETFMESLQVRGSRMELRFDHEKNRQEWLAFVRRHALRPGKFQTRSGAVNRPTSSMRSLRMPKTSLSPDPSISGCTRPGGTAPNRCTATGNPDRADGDFQN